MKISHSANINSRIHQRALVRLHRLCAEIRNQHYPNKAQLAGAMGLNPRTVQRDLATLRNDFAAPLEYDRDQNGFYFRDPRWKLPPLTMTEGELLGFFIAERTLRHMDETTEVRLLREALNNLAALLPKEVSVDLMALKQSMSFVPETVADVPPDILRRLTEAARNRETLQIEYYPPLSRESVVHEVNVLLVHNLIGEWYATCWDISRQSYQDFHAGHITDIARTGRCFEPPPDWGREALHQRSFGAFVDGRDVRVEIEFDALQARFAREQQFHRFEQRRQLKDGRLRISFAVTEAALEQVAHCLMKYGEHAVVRKPMQLRKIMLEQLWKTSSRYETGGRGI